MSGESSESALRLELAEASKAGSSVVSEVVGLFDQLRDRLLRYVLSLGLPAQDGEEIIQEVFLLLFRHLQSGKSRSNLRGWVFRVTHTLVLKKRSQERLNGHNLGDVMAVSEAWLRDPSPNPEEQLVSSQKRQRLLGALTALPEQDQRCLSLRAEGLTYREIAGVLDISLGAVALSLSKSLARLARAAER